MSGARSGRAKVVASIDCLGMILVGPKEFLGRKCTALVKRAGIIEGAKRDVDERNPEKSPEPQHQIIQSDCINASNWPTLVFLGD